MKILVIGGTNFIGPAVVRRLYAMGHEVTVFNRRQNQADLPVQVNYLKGDRNNLQEFKPEFERLAPQIVLDMIPFTEGEAQTLMNTFRGITQRVVAISSMDVYRAYDVLWNRESEIMPTPLMEDSPLRQQLYPYRGMPEKPLDFTDDYEKILVERIVMADRDLPGTVIRLPMVYGAGDPRHRFYAYLKRMEENRPVILLEESVARWRSSYGYVENVAHAIALATTNHRAIAQIYHVAEPEALSELERIRKIGELVSWKGVAIALSKDLLPKEWKGGFNFAQHWVVDSSRLRQELGYEEIVPVDKSLQQAIAWQLSHPPTERSFWEVPYLLDYATEDKLMSEL
ncbi:NAD-dependent dehydratase [Hydrococcus rivularis NIES-593]|uniref:NAD-dependent dehydratase n=1 Tax=Hydrococcus rivularis NIES-593 TaxID=1921803 RepID=A0A1U7HRA5_9CYAN|nr:NAD-dependent epimerase/dehydratase family protein [Hydrococcus rivularis]OKH26101.1 NAD-dependent dehydratase [Hydrococcus rivularis NIES-593]